MAGNLKRRRANVSYKEPSSDEAVSGDSDHGQTRRPGPAARPTGRRGAPPVVTASTNGLQLRTRPEVSYQEPNSATESESDFDPDDATLPPPMKRPRPTPSPRAKNESTQRRQPRALGGPLKPKRDSQLQSAAAAPKVPSDMVIPPWSTLPYHVLLQIFVYASHPLHDENFTPTPSIAWLARTARICSDFTKPALTALYRNPPIFAVRQNRKALVQHLISPPSKPYVDYSVMVKRLEIDATKMSRLTDPQSSASDLLALISSLKTLREIDIFDPSDRPPYRRLSKDKCRWQYPDDLFDTLDQSGVRLLGWRWNGTYLAKDLLWMKEVHTRTAFQSLREVTFTKIPSKALSKLEEGEPTAEELLGSALAVLPNIKLLAFETCTVLNERLLPLLPENLVSLNITNCKDLTSEALQAFLVTHGSHLQELILNHNQSLNLSFLVHLKQHCPRLEVLRMDLNYYSTLSLSSDNEPLYDNLLDEDEIPSWPSTLAVIDFEFLRNWTAACAVNFFRSLVDSAEELPWLREIIITAIVDLDWRRRAEFRKRWTDRFHRVFARKPDPPDQSLMSLRAFRERNQDGKIPSTSNADLPTTTILGDTSTGSDSDVPLVTRRGRKGTEKWGQKRLRSRANASTNYDESSGGEEGDQEEPSPKSDEPDAIQGGCYKVVFRIDNSRPQEQIFDEGDFLDEEASGDEDWDGNDIVDDGYAW